MPFESQIRAINSPPQSYRASWYYQSFLFTNWCTRELV